jgi:hypothetical protein
LNTKAGEAGFMTKITYIPPEGDAAECLWGEYLFRANVPLQVSDAHILAKAATNPHFAVENHAARIPSNETPKPRKTTARRKAGRGKKARALNKKGA